MRINRTYRSGWRDLRRRNLLFWFFVLSYVPGMLLIIVSLRFFGPDIPERIGTYFSVAWLAGYVGASLYRQKFRCPRCHQLYFRRGRLVENGRRCTNCNLALWAPGP